MDYRNDRVTSQTQLEKEMVRLHTKKNIIEAVESIGVYVSSTGTKEKYANDFYRGVLELMNKNKALGIADQVTFSSICANIKDPYVANTVRKNLKAGFEPSRRTDIPSVRSGFNAIENLKDSFKCICDNSSVAESVQCEQCHKSFHPECLKIPKNQRFECPYCFAYFMDPSNEVKQVLFCGYLKAQNKVHRLNFPYKDQPEYSKYHVQARCFRLDNKNNYSITWPDIGDIKLNDNKILDLKPLAENSSLKKRKDDVKVIERRHLRTNNTIMITEPYSYARDLRVGHNTHFIMICLVRTIPKSELHNKILNKWDSVKKEDDIIGFQEGDLEMERVYVELKCPLGLHTIKVPVRGSECVHENCVDLNNVIAFSSRQWRCPICKKKAHNLQVNRRLYNIILQNPKINIAGVTFFKDGGFNVTEEKPEVSSDESEDDRRKPIVIDLDSCEDIDVPLTRESTTPNEPTHTIAKQRDVICLQQAQNLPMRQFVQMQQEELDQRESSDSGLQSDPNFNQEQPLPKNSEAQKQAPQIMLPIPLQQNVFPAADTEVRIQEEKENKPDLESESQSVVLLPSNRKPLEQVMCFTECEEQKQITEPKFQKKLESPQVRTALTDAPAKSVETKPLANVIEIIDSDDQSQQQKIQRKIRNQQYQLKNLRDQKNMVPSVANESHYRAVRQIANRLFPLLGI